MTHRLARQKAAVGHIMHCAETFQSRIILNEWNVVAQQARRTRDYFDRVERGDDGQQANGGLGRTSNPFEKENSLNRCFFFLRRSR